MTSSIRIGDRALEPFDDAHDVGSFAGGMKSMTRTRPSASAIRSRGPACRRGSGGCRRAAALGASTSGRVRGRRAARRSTSSESKRGSGTSRPSRFGRRARRSAGRRAARSPRSAPASAILISSANSGNRLATARLNSAKVLGRVLERSARSDRASRRSPPLRLRLRRHSRRTALPLLSGLRAL